MICREFGGIPNFENITSTSAGVAASLLCRTTNITTNGDADLDNVTLTNGSAVNHEKVFLVKTLTHASDTIKVTPTNLNGGTQITFNAAGQGCTMIFDGTNWNIVANNGGTIA